MPNAGATIEPVVDTSTKRNPMIGPVQENDTNVRVKAMRKMLSSPLVFSALLSTALLHDAGSVISKAPKNDAAKTTSIRKKKMLKMALVDKALRALAPNMSVIIRPKATYITMIDIP